MYDIYFDLNDMHQTVSESDDEFWGIGESFDFDLGLDEPYTDDYPVVVQKPKHKSNGNGCNCTKCGEAFPFAEPNQPDGSFKCWSCRNY